jgi:hypothetical protein
VLTYRGAQFEVRTTRSDCFDQLRSIFVTDGTPGIKEFFAENGLTSRIVPGVRTVSEVPPEQHLDAQRLALYRLLDVSRNRISQLTLTAVKAAGPFALSAAEDRLVEARVEIESEARRYLTGTRSETMLSVVLDPGVPASLFRLRPGSVDVVGLRRELVVCQELQGAADRARKALQEARRAAEVDATVALVPMGEGATGPPVSDQQIRDYANRHHSELANLGTASRSADAALGDQLMLGGMQYPVLFRIVEGSGNLSDDELARRIVLALRRAHAANLATANSLHDDPATVWHYPSVVRNGLQQNYIPQFSIAWMAAEEQLNSVAGPRLSAQLGIFSGFAVMGESALSALVGVGVLAPPLVLALAVADVLINLYDVVQDFLEYLRQSDAFAACLDPSLSLAAEPSLFLIAVTIIGNILAVVL